MTKSTILTTLNLGPKIGSLTNIKMHCFPLGYQFDNKWIVHIFPKEIRQKGFFTSEPRGVASTYTVVANDCDIVSWRTGNLKLGNFVRQIKRKKLFKYVLTCRVRVPAIDRTGRSTPGLRAAAVCRRGGRVRHAPRDDVIHNPGCVYCLPKVKTLLSTSTWQGVPTRRTQNHGVPGIVHFSIWATRLVLVRTLLCCEIRIELLHSSPLGRDWSVYGRRNLLLC